MVSLTSIADTARPWLLGPLIRIRSRLPLLGPAFVAAIAYVDPGNFATNISAGSRHGFLLLWVLVAANVAAGLIQYLSAKTGLITGASLPRLLGARLRPVPRVLFWLQAEAVVMATDIAEVIGGAVALRLLFGWSLLFGGVVTGTVSSGLLMIRDRRGRRAFELALTTALGLLAGGFVIADISSPPSALDVARGLVPHLGGGDGLLLAAGIIGATVMPHAVYLHSALVPHERRTASAAARALTATRLDVGAAMVLAGGVNAALLLFAATTVGGSGADSLEDAHAAIGHAAGPASALLLAVALLISGFTGTAVGNHAGAVVMEGLLHRRVPTLVRRLVTLVPALAVLVYGISATEVLVYSQIVLSFGIPIALLAVLRITAGRDLMGRHVNHPLTTAAGALVAAGVVAVNAALVTLTVT